MGYTLGIPQNHDIIIFQEKLNIQETSFTWSLLSLSSAFAAAISLFGGIQNFPSSHIKTILVLQKEF